MAIKTIVMRAQTCNSACVSLWMSDDFDDLAVKHQTQVLLALMGDGVDVGPLNKIQKECAKAFGFVIPKGGRYGKA